VNEMKTLRHIHSTVLESQSSSVCVCVFVKEKEFVCVNVSH